MRYKVWLNEADEYPEEGLGWRIILETDDEELAELTCDKYMYSYVEDEEE